MLFNKENQNTLRQYCRTTIESLELWLRRLIDQTLINAYGSNYIGAQYSPGQNLFNSHLKRGILDRKASDPARYPRFIDACLLEDEIEIICKPNLYNLYFEQVFQPAFPFPHGQDILRGFLNRIVAIRNKTSHANPISVRDAERAICYSNDIIDAIKDYYVQKGMNQEFNVPIVQKYSDHFGTVLHRNQFNDPGTGTIIVDFTKDPHKSLRPGDTIRIEIEVDPSFQTNEYTIKWSGGSISDTEGRPELIYTIQLTDVSERFYIKCMITSNKAWHRFKLYDDYLLINFKVLPPIQ